MEENAKQIAELLKVLANKNRLLIICALLENRMTVSDIANYVPGITQGSLSQHLAILRSNGVLDNEKQGQNVFYFIADLRIKEIIAVLQENFCPVA